MQPATDKQIELMRDFWSHYGQPPHKRELNATLLKKDFLSLIARLERADPAVLLNAFQRFHARVEHRKRTVQNPGAGTGCDADGVFVPGSSTTNVEVRCGEVRTCLFEGDTINVPSHEFLGGTP